MNFLSWLLRSLATALAAAASAFIPAPKRVPVKAASRRRAGPR